MIKGVVTHFKYFKPFLHMINIISIRFVIVFGVLIKALPVGGIIIRRRGNDQKRRTRQDQQKRSHDFKVYRDRLRFYARKL